jgi:hypothetical protein
MKIMSLPRRLQSKMNQVMRIMFLSQPLTSTVTHGSDTWLIDSGASKHMIGYEDSLSNRIHKDSPCKVKLGDNYQHPIKGVGKLPTS